MTRSAFVRPLESVDRSMRDQVGGKAACLGELLQAGLPVPDGFVLIWPGDGSDEATPAMREELVRAYDALCARTGLDRVAVRSSGALEDRAAASFAGLYESFLNVRGAEAVEDAARACARSAEGEGVDRYRRHQGLDSVTDPGFAVLVQVLVDAEAAGVVFTNDPVSHSPEHIVVDAAFGLGLSVVGGTVVPDHYVVDRSSLAVVEHRPGRKDHAVEANRAGAGTRSRTLPEARASERVLDDAQLADLVRVALEAEARLGGPQDLEWALHEGCFHVLQSRPITTSPAPEAAGPSCAGEASWGSGAERTSAFVEELAPGSCPTIVAGPAAAALEAAVQTIAIRIGLEAGTVSADLDRVPARMDAAALHAMAQALGSMADLGLDPRLRSVGAWTPRAFDRLLPGCGSELSEALVARIEALLSCATHFGVLLESERDLRMGADPFVGIGGYPGEKLLEGLERSASGDATEDEDAALLATWIAGEDASGWGEVANRSPGAANARERSHELDALRRQYRKLPEEMAPLRRHGKAAKSGARDRARLIESLGSRPTRRRQIDRALRGYGESARALLVAAEAIAARSRALLAEAGDSGTSSGRDPATSIAEAERGPSSSSSAALGFTAGGRFERRGRGASPGRAMGPLRRILGAPRAEALQIGDILWTPVACRGWLPYLPLLGGWIVDSGAPLACGVLNARELGVPTVIGAAEPPPALGDGIQVQIDGATGELSADQR